ncbi:MAG: thioredoxin [Nanoarchaeota archaeon]|nr:thioredoxin [Nanoarchaeota archaeon]MBU1501395.1 thioredoxin [Nanoarchaeota archaeon]MBU2458872.1 thioredoxin [Nanoarchaeota archaeon]
MESEFDGFVKEGKVIVDFYADWCMPCVTMAPIVEELAEKFNGKIKFGKVNVDDNDALTKKFGVDSMPSFLVFKEGEVVGKFSGAMSIQDFEEKLKGFL